MSILLLTWLHTVAMIGALSALLSSVALFPASVQNDRDSVARVVRWINILIGAGLLFGILLFGAKKGHLLGAHYMGVIGVKFALLVAAGGLNAMSKRSEKGQGMRLSAGLLLLLASLLGSVFLSR